MKKSIIFKYLMALVVIAMSAMVVASCGDDDDDNGGSNGSGIYGTWVSTLEDGEVVTVVIAQNSMKIQWAYDDESETEIYDSFSYDESTKKITAHHCKTIYVYDGKTTEEEDDGIVTCYVNWIDNNHITNKIKIITIIPFIKNDVKSNLLFSSSIISSPPNIAFYNSIPPY